MPTAAEKSTDTPYVIVGRRIERIVRGCKIITDIAGDIEGADV